MLTDIINVHTNVNTYCQLRRCLYEASEINSSTAVTLCWSEQPLPRAFTTVKVTSVLLRVKSEVTYCVLLAHLLFAYSNIYAMMDD